MTQLNIPCVFLPGPCPQAQLIPAAQLQAHFQAASALTQTQAACEDLQEQARLTLQQAQEEAEQIRQQAYQQGRLDAEQAWAEQQQALIEQTLQWHVSHTNLEATLALQLDTRIRTLVAAALEEYLGEQHAADLLVRRVQQRLGRFLPEDAITLRVADTCHAKAREEMAAYPHVRVIHCATLKPTQAQVQTALFTLHIDLEQHLDSLLSRLKPLANEPDCDDYQNRPPEPQTGRPAAASAAPPARRRDADFPCAIGA